MAELRDQLAAEYTMLQNQYETFDTRALTIKSWSAPLLAGGLGIALKDNLLGLALATALVALCSWIVEAMWKSFQYSYIGRTELLESYFRGEIEGDALKPYQIRQAWKIDYKNWYGKPEALWSLFWKPFVFLPYFPIVLACIPAIVWIVANKK